MERRSSCSNLIVVLKFTSEEFVCLVSASLAFGECWQIHVARASVRGRGYFRFQGDLLSFVSFCKRAAEDYNRSKEDNVTSLVNTWRWQELSPACCTLHLTFFSKVLSPKDLRSEQLACLSFLPSRVLSVSGFLPSTFNVDLPAPPPLFMSLKLVCKLWDHVIVDVRDAKEVINWSSR